MVKVRHYRAQDRTAVSALLEELSEAHRILYRDPTIGSPAQQRAFRARLLSHGPSNVWVAVERRQIVGLAGLIPHRGHGELEPLVVTARCRRQGIGRKLVQTVVDEAVRRGWKALSVRPVARNTTALRTLHALGFRTLGHLELDLALKGHGWFVPAQGPRIAGRRFRA